MYELFFFFFAAFTVFLSIKLSFYADQLGKNSKISKAFIGGILLAGVTSLPEFITCISAVFMDNPYLAVGDILGSNFFNLFIVAFFDLLFIKKMLFSHTKNYHFIVYLFLIINYIVLYLFVRGIFSSVFLRISLPTVVTFVTYFIYLHFTSSWGQEEVNTYIGKPPSFLIFKVIITAFLMILSSILLTFIVNKIALLHPRFSSSLFGAILLGITTSLPEVITFYTLFSLNSYDLAISNIVGSNLFNLFVLAMSDLFLPVFSVYQFFDRESVLLLKLGLLVTVLGFVHHIWKNKNKWVYGFFSFLTVIVYIVFWVYHFHS